MSTRPLLLTLALLLAPALAGAQPTRPPPQDYVPLVGIDVFLRVPKLHTTVHGWSLTGSRPEAYELRCSDLLIDCTVPVLRTRATADEPFGVGSLTHSEDASPLRGMRVRLRVELRPGRVGGWAGVWMRVEGPEQRVLAFDNMQNRAVRGTNSYDWYSVVLDVPPDAEMLYFGVLLHGPGAVFIKDVVFEVVDQSVPVTDLMAPLRASTAGSTGGGSF